MSVLIKGMKMPERCEGCLMYRHNAEYDYAYCCVSSVYVLGHGNARVNNCPLVEVPTPHGPLVDADELILNSVSGIEIYHISAAPTIIEAEKGEPNG